MNCATRVGRWLRVWALSILGAWASAAVGDQRGFFVEAGVGAGPVERKSIEGLGARRLSDLGAPLASLSLGYAFDNGVRFALEGAHRSNDVEIIEFPRLGGYTVSGSSDEISARSVMFNAFYEWDAAPGFSPFVGVGLGRADVEFALSDAESGRTILDDRDSTAAIQVIAGFGVQLRPSWQLRADYRYWHAPSIGLDDPANQYYETSHTSHSVWLSTRYLFDSGKARPSPPLEQWLRASSHYWAIGLGAGFAQDADLGSSAANLDAFRVGSAFTTAFGMPWSKRFSWEVEASYRDNDIEIVDFGRLTGESPADGNVKAASLMANLLYDFHRSQAVGAYIGAGVGVSHLDFDISTSGETFLGDQQTEVAFQLILGTRAALSRRVQFMAEYRYWFAPWLSLTNPEDNTLDTHHNIHTVMLGFQIRPGR